MQAQAEVPPIPNTAVDALQPQTKSPSLGAATDLAKGHLAKAQVEASPTQVEFSVGEALSPKEPSTVAQLATVTPDAPGISDPAMAQVNSVSELSDVQPTDWAYQALKSLVERYGVVTGYSDGTFRGQRSLTRYEFATTLNAVFAEINDLITAGRRTDIDPEDLETLQQLQTTYGLALSDLRDRMADMEGRTS